MKSNIVKKTIQRLLKQAKKDRVRKIVVRAVIKRNNKFLLLERALSDFLGGLVILPGGTVDTDEDLLQALVREVKEETNLVITEIISYIGSFDYASSSGKKTRQFNFFIETEPGNIRINQSEHSNYYLLNPSDEEFSKLNISDSTKTILSTVQKKYS
ncbi:MAG: NUDIX hydrolase [Candidatus Staskawiczbacteria bacterium]|nr:NUDIX hydrolase [Candidatus Staskawiczbacteria bacterium]